MAKCMQALLMLAAMSPLLGSAKLVILGDSLSDNGVDGILAGTELVNNKFSTGPVSFSRIDALIRLSALHVLYTGARVRAMH